MVVGQSKASLADLLREHAVLLYDVVNDLGVVAVDPAGGCGERSWRGNTSVTMSQSYR